MPIFKILSFDIKCAGRKGIFPEANHDFIILTANMLMRHGEKEPFLRHVFTLNTSAPSYKKETELMEAWNKFVRHFDPNILTSYNIKNFDVPHPLNRAQHLKVKNFDVIKNTMNQSKQMGRRENKQANFESRVLFDLLSVLFRDYKLRFYTLNSVSYNLLQKQKKEDHHNIITDLQNKSE